MAQARIGERRAQIILLVRAFEESDPEGLILPLRERAKATRRAMMVTGLSDESGSAPAAWRIRFGEAILRRARLLYDGLRGRHPSLERILALSRLGSSTAPVVLVGAFLSGLLTNALGPQRSINLLSLPLLGLLGWNLAIYTAMAVLALAGRLRSWHGLADSLSGVFFRGAIWRRIHGRRVGDGPLSPESRIIVRAVMRYGASWHRLARELLTARVRRMLHQGAIAMIAGVVTGMYVRGFAFEYRVTWESTWLDAQGMQGLVAWLLGPAAWLTGVQIPDVAPLRGPQGDGPAALWIHLYAVTALLVVGLPRTLMVSFEAWRAWRLARDLPLDPGESYYRRLFTAWRGATRHVAIVPYSFTPSPAAMASLKTLLFDFFGARADLRPTVALSYGSDAESFAQDALPVEADDADSSERESCVVAVLNLAQPPEAEVHGAFLERLTSVLDARHSQLLVVIDVSSYRARVEDPARIRERIETWERVVRGAGLSALAIDLERHRAPAGAAGEGTKDDTIEDLLSAMRAALWPGPGSAEAP